MALRTLRPHRHRGHFRSSGPAFSTGSAILVGAALAYYYDHREEIQQDIHEAQVLVATLKAQMPSKLHAKLSTRDHEPDTLSPA
jgi:hypothetical protein